jgi:hypothetical protein
MDTPPDAPDMGSAPEAPDTETGEAPDAGPETASLPIDFCGQTPPSPGDIIRVKVVSVDSDNGSFDVSCVQSMQPAARGIKAAVASLGSQ